jgi:hypothetical protein
MRRRSENLEGGQGGGKEGGNDAAGQGEGEAQTHARHGEGGNRFRFELANDGDHVHHVIFFPHPLWQSAHRRSSRQQHSPQEMFGPLGISIVLIASVSIVAALFSIPMMSLEAQSRRVDLYRKMEEDSEEVMPVL